MEVGGCVWSGGGLRVGVGAGARSAELGNWLYFATYLLTTYRLALQRSEGGPVAQLDGELRRRLCDVQPDMRVHAQL